MNLTKLFETQRKLDDRILEEHPELKGQNNLDWKILALQVELGECANEWRGFKKWSKDQEPRKEVICHACNGECCFHGAGESITIDGVVTAFYEPCAYCGGTGVQERPLLEEYVDCLHFILSIGLELGCQDLIIKDFFHYENDITKHIKYVFYTVSSLDERIVCKDEEESIHEMYGWLFGGFIALGEMLGFTWDEVEQAYYAKNAVNHQRQEEGY